jgi:hypothetical protein
VPPGSTPLRELGEKQHLEVARQRARRVQLACRLATQHPFTDDRDLAAATGLLGQPDVSDEAAEAREMTP